MGRTNVYDKRKLFGCEIKVGGANLIYAFDTPVDTAELTKLGCKAITTNEAKAISATNLVIYEANLPKPAKGKTENATSYIATATGLALPDGVKVVKGIKTYRFNPANTEAWESRASKGTTSGSVAVYVEMLGIFYAWRMPFFQAALITDADATELGIQVPTATNAARMVFGATCPRPARVQKRLGFVAGTKEDPGIAAKLLSTFCAQNKVNSLTTWTKVRDGILQIAASGAVQAA